MSDIKISQLPEVSSLIPSDIGPVVASGVTSKITVQNLAGTLPTVSSSISASYAVTASYTISSSYALSASFVQSASFATNASNSVSASYAATASSADNFLVRQDITGSNALFTGTITAQKLVVQVISSSVIYSSGSNKFGDELTDIQQFTGSVRITGSMIVNAPTLFNDQVLANNITGSLFGTASWARNAITASYVTGAIFNSTNPALSASYALSASFAATTISASYALSSSYAVTASRSITASYAISSSYAEVAGFVTGSNVYGPYGSNSIISASFASSSAQAISSSYSVSSSYALSASYAVSASQSVSSSFALTASYLSGYIEPFPYTGSAQITGSLGVTGSISSTQGFSGSLFGTSSWAENAVTASFVTGSNVWGPFGSNSIISASYAITASYALNGGSGTSNPAVGFTQSLAATTWSFTHNLNTRIPIVQAFDTAYNQIIPNAIQTIDPSTVEIRFTYAQAGYAIASNGGSYTVSGSTSRLNQSVANVTWSFAHGLNSQYVNYEIYDSNNFVIIPAGIKAVDSNNAEIYFATATSGVAIAMFSGINGAPNAATASFAFTASLAISASQAVSSSYPFAVTGSTIYTTAFGGTQFISKTESIFIGQNAGLSSSYEGYGNQNDYIVAVGHNAASASLSPEASVSIGHKAGASTFLYEAVSIGRQAGYSSSFIQGGVHIGARAGSESGNLGYAVALGSDAGSRIKAFGSGVYYSIFIGSSAGYFSTQPGYSSVFIGNEAGAYSGYLEDTVAIGNGAGESAITASFSNFIGLLSGYQSTKNTAANFIGSYSGQSANSASYTTAIGHYTAYNITSSQHSVLIGSGVGRRSFLATSNGIGNNNIIIGKNITLENGRQNSINFGAIIFATGSYSADPPNSYGFDNPFSGSANGRVGINVVNPVYTLDVSGSGNYTNGLTVTGSLIANTITGSLQGTASLALTASYISPITSGYVVLTQVSQSLDYADDTAAAAGGVPLGGLYRNGNFILIRIT